MLYSKLVCVLWVIKCTLTGLWFRSHPLRLVRCLPKGEIKGLQSQKCSKFTANLKDNKAIIYSRVQWMPGQDNGNSPTLKLNKLGHSRFCIHFIFLGQRCNQLEWVYFKSQPAHNELIIPNVPMCLSNFIFLFVFIFSFIHCMLNLFHLFLHGNSHHHNFRRLVFSIYCYQLKFV